MCHVQVVFELEGVFVHPSGDEEDTEEDFLVCGSLRIVEKVNVFTI